MLLFLNRQQECTSYNLVGLLSNVRIADGIFHLCDSLIRDLKIRGRDKLNLAPGVPFVMRWKNRSRSPSLTKRIAASGNEIGLPEVNFHKEPCAHEAQTRVLTVLVSSRTRFSQPSSRLVFTYSKTQSISFSDMLTMVFLKIIFFTIFVGNISK